MSNSAQSSLKISKTLGLTANEAIIKAALGVKPKGYIFVSDLLPSKYDAKAHYTVDAYGTDEHNLDKPIGCIHVYEDNTLQVFTTPRSEPWLAYEAKLKAKNGNQDV